MEETGKSAPSSPMSPSRTSRIRSRKVPPSARSTARSGQPNLGQRVSHVAEQLELIQSRAKKNGKEAKRVFKQNKIIKKDLDEFKAHIHRHVSDVIKEITDHRLLQENRHLANSAIWTKLIFEKGERVSQGTLGIL